MKKLTFIELLETITIFTLTTCITMFLAQASYGASAKKETKKINKQIELINSLENSGDISSAFQQTIKLQQHLENVLQINQVVVSVESKLNEIYQEKVISSSKSGFNLFGLIFSGEGTYSSQETDMFLQNDKETQYFSTKKSKDLESVKQNLKNYIQYNIDGLVFYKIVTLKALDLAGQLRINNLQSLERMTGLNSKVSFQGLHKITHCVQNNFIQQTSDGSAEISLLGLVGFGFSHSHTTYAKTTKNCKSTFNTVNSQDVDYVLLALNEIDEQIEAKKKSIFAKAVVEVNPSPFPTFDSPYYK